MLSFCVEDVLGSLYAMLEARTANNMHILQVTKSPAPAFFPFLNPHRCCRVFDEFLGVITMKLLLRSSIALVQ
jgi:hypothetical protein